MWKKSHYQICNHIIKCIKDDKSPNYTFILGGYKCHFTSIIQIQTDLALYVEMD